MHNQKSNRICDQLVVNFEPWLLNLFLCKLESIIIVWRIKLTVHCMCNLQVNVSKPWNTIVTLEIILWKFLWIDLGMFLWLILQICVTYFSIYMQTIFTRCSQSALLILVTNSRWTAGAHMCYLLFHLDSCNLNSQVKLSHSFKPRNPLSPKSDQLQLSPNNINT